MAKKPLPPGAYWNGERYVEPGDPAYDARMGAWIVQHLDNPRVLRWLVRNPPPPEWEGSHMEYAYTEMPFAPR
jgi:hypothetical protein